MNKTINHIKKLYQATIDGADPINFHKKCDNIQNTLVLIKSQGQRRFGGFTPIPWKSKRSYIEDSEKQTFVFSLDNKKIYNLKNSQKTVYHRKAHGLCFGEVNDIGNVGNLIKENTLYTYQSSYDYYGAYYSLSEYKEDGNRLKAYDYEDFQVIFN